MATASATSVSRRVSRPMRMHMRGHGVWLEPRVALELEEGRWKGGRTGGLRLAAMAGAAEQLCVALEQM
jgi:hypothetical protein